MDRHYRLFIDSITIFSHDDVQDRVPMVPWGTLTDADFLDGSEMLTACPLEGPSSRIGRSYAELYNKKRRVVWEIEATDERTKFG